MTDLNETKPMTGLRRRDVMKGLVAAALSGPALAQAGYPDKAVRVVIPFPPGGPTDIVGRIVAQALSERLGQPFTVDNRPGASGMIGADLVAKAPADGRTLLVNVSAQVANSSLYDKMPHDPLNDFTPITNLAYTPIQLVVAESFPAQSLADLVKLVKSQPGRHSFASSSSGAPGHLMGELFKQLAGLDVVHVPYKGAAPALVDVIGGQVSFMFDSMPSSITLVKSGKLRALGVSSPKRMEALPDVPTFAEQNFPALNLTTWYGMWGPAKLPPILLDQIYDEVSKVLALPDVRKRIQDSMAQPVGDTPQEFAAFCATEAKRYASIIKVAGIKLG